MKKRFLAILLTLCMMLSLAPAAFAAETDPFTDVATADWYYDEVVYAYEHGLMQGTSATTFSPDTTTSRAMIVTILYRLENEPAVSAAGTFTDVAAGQYYTEAVEWAYANNIVGGYGNSLFGPTDLLTREQMAAILYRYADYKGYDVSAAADLSSYTDAASISAYALAAMQWANYNGLVNGTSATTLSPNGAATRAQFAVILYRFCETVAADPSLAEEYTVTFEYNYGSKGAYKTVTVDEGETVKQPSNPTRSSYSFSGWYTKASGGSKFDFDTEITADLILYAHWSYNGGGSSGHSHKYGDWEYTGNGYHQRACSCGDVETKACSFGWHDLGTEHVKKCAVCNEIVAQGAHVYNEDGLCEVCSALKQELTGGDTENPVASIGSTGYATFDAALAAATDSTPENPVVILLEQDISVNSQITVNRSNVKINGNGKTITANNDNWSAENGYKNLVLVTGDNVSIENLVLESNNQACGLQIYDCSNFGIYSSTLKNSKNAGMNVNRSDNVWAVEVTAEDNAWGSINVDHRNDNGNLSLSVVDCDLTDNKQIWSEVSFGVVTVYDEGYYRYCYVRESDDQTFYCWTTAAPTGCEAMMDGAYYQTLELALSEIKKWDMENAGIDLLADAELNVSNPYIKLGSDDTDSITINGHDQKLTLTTSYWSRLNTAHEDAALILNDLTVTSSQTSGTWNSYDVTFMCNTELNNVTFEKAVTINGEGSPIEVVMNGVSISESNDYYALWIVPGCTVEIDGLTIDSQGRGIKIDNEYLSGSEDLTTHLTITDATFNTSKKAAILVKTDGETYIELSNVDIQSVTADTTNAVWVDEDASDTFDLVSVSGGTCVIEGSEYVAQGVYKKGDTYLIFDANGMTWFAETVNAGTDFSGKTIKLLCDIDLNGVKWTPIGNTFDARFRGTFDGGGYTISNLSVNSAEATGLFGYMSATVQNLTVVDATVTGNHWGGIIAGYALGTITDCHVKNSTVTLSARQLSDGNYDDGDKAGGIVGYLTAEPTAVLTSCSVSNTTITAYRDLGGIAGYANLAANVSNNTVTNVTLIVDTENNYKNYAKVTDYDTGSIVGEANTSASLSSNAGTADVIVELATGFRYVATASETFYEVSSAEGMFNFAEQVSDKNNNFSGMTVYLTADIDLNNEVWTPIGQTGVTRFQGIFDGQGYTISNLKVYSSSETGDNYSSGLFGWIDVANTSIKNLTVNGASVTGHHNVAVIVGYAANTVTIENCHVKNAVLVNTHATNGACGDKTGLIVGNANSSIVKNCTGADSTVSGCRDAGQLLGAAKTSNVTDCSAENVTMTVLTGCNDSNAGKNIAAAVIGRNL